MARVSIHASHSDSPIDDHPNCASVSNLINTAIQPTEIVVEMLVAVAIIAHTSTTTTGGIS